MDQLVLRSGVSARPIGLRRDFSGPLQHVMVCGIERRPIFVDDTDRPAFLAWLSAPAHPLHGGPDDIVLQLALGMQKAPASPEPGTLEQAAREPGERMTS